MDANKILSTRGLNTLMFQDPYAKLCYNALLVSQFDNVTYIDLDTTFTAYFMAGFINAKQLNVYLPTEGRLGSTIKDALASMPTSSLVIFDSVNSFYNLFKMSENNIGSLNHLLSILLMLLVRSAIDEGIPVFATSMLRYRKDQGWLQSPASRRLLQHKSKVKLSIERQDNDLVLKILQHELLPTGTEFVYKDSIIAV